MGDRGYGSLTPGRGHRELGEHGVRPGRHAGRRRRRRGHGGPARGGARPAAAPLHRARRAGGERPRGGHRVLDARPVRGADRSLPHDGDRGSHRRGDLGARRRGGGGRGPGGGRRGERGAGGDASPGHGPPGRARPTDGGQDGHDPEQRRCLAGGLHAGVHDHRLGREPRQQRAGPRSTAARCRAATCRPRSGTTSWSRRSPTSPPTAFPEPDAEPAGQPPIRGRRGGPGRTSSASSARPRARAGGAVDDARPPWRTVTDEGEGEDEDERRRDGEEEDGATTCAVDHRRPDAPPRRPPRRQRRPPRRRLPRRIRRHRGWWLRHARVLARSCQGYGFGRRREETPP